MLLRLWVQSVFLIILPEILPNTRFLIRLPILPFTTAFTSPKTLAEPYNTDLILVKKHIKYFHKSKQSIIYYQIKR